MFDFLLQYDELSREKQRIEIIKQRSHESIYERGKNKRSSPRRIASTAHKPKDAKRFFQLEEASEHLDEQKEELVRQFVTHYENHQAEEEKLLNEFMKDFVESEDFINYMEERANIIRKNIAIQYDSNDYAPKPEAIKEYPLTIYSKKIIAFKRNLEKFAEKQMSDKILERQLRGIEIIKDKIAEARAAMIRNKPHLEIMKNRKTIEELCRKANINLSSLKEQSQIVVLKKAWMCHKLASKRRIRMRQNLMNIIRKLLNEYAKYYLGYKKPIRKRERVLKVIDEIKLEYIKESEIELEESQESNIQVFSEPQPVKAIEEVSEIKQSKSKPRTSRVSSKIREDFFEEKEKEVREVKEERMSRKSKAEPVKKKSNPDEYEIPSYPIVNPRRKLACDRYQRMLDLIKEFEYFDQILEDRMFTKNLTKLDPEYVPDELIQINPKEITFKGFKVNVIYRRRLIFFNKGKMGKKVRFVKAQLSDEMLSIYFKIKMDGIVKMHPGTHIKILIEFFTPDNLNHFEGKLLFYTLSLNDAEYRKVEVPLFCIPQNSELILPEEIDFGAYPIWEAQKNLKNIKKTVKVFNQGDKSCRFIIKKRITDEDLEDLEKDMNSKGSKTFEDSSTSFGGTVFSSEDNDFNFMEEYLNKIEEEGEATDENLLFSKRLLSHWVDSVFNKFIFNSYLHDLPGNESTYVQVFPKKIDYVGLYHEEYDVDIYEMNDSRQSLVCTGSRSLLIKLEITGAFVSVTPYVDFGMCIINSTYQTSIEIENESKAALSFVVKLPASVTDYVSTNESILYIQGHQKRVIWIKFSPKISILDHNIPYFDKDTKILQFPIQISITTKNYAQVPSSKSMVYAVVAHYDGLKLKPLQSTHVEIRSESLAMNLGACSLFETVKTQISLTNESLNKHFYAFLNLPPSILINPNYGFGEIAPGEVKILNVFFSPSLDDANELKEDELESKITVTSLASLSKLKVSLDVKRLRKSTEFLIKQIKDKNKEQLQLDMMNCVKEFKKEIPGLTKTEIETLRAEDDVIIECHWFENMEERLSSVNLVHFDLVKSNSLWISAKILKPFCQFSAQFLHLPDTPVGSYSVMDVKLEALKILKGYNCSEKLPKFEAKFELFSNDSQILIEPSCGFLKDGESARLFIVAKPEIPNEDIFKTAKDLKYQKMYNDSLERLEEERMRNLEGKASIKRNSKAFKKLSVTVEDVDLFPAEMFFWRTFDERFIHTRINCKIQYNLEEKKEDVLFLDVHCKIVRPSFILDLDSQVLDFKSVAVGFRSTKIIHLQNISFVDITPNISILNPVGPFYIADNYKTSIMPEHILKIPVYFSPTESIKYLEHIEISVDGTIIPLVLKGEGTSLSFEIRPASLIRRVVTNSKKSASLSFEIENSNEESATISFIKLFELEGIMRKIDLEIPVVVDKNDKKDKKEKKNIKMNSFCAVDSDELTEEELYSIENFFQLKNDNFMFSVKEEVEVGGWEVLNIDMLFNKDSEREESYYDVKKKNVKSTNTEEKDPKQSLTKGSVWHLAKYNMILNGGVFLRDLIVIGEVK